MHALLVAEFVEVESGRKNLRPKLAAAKASDAVSAIAKLDLLFRNAGYAFALRDSEMDLVSTSRPDANTLRVDIKHNTNAKPFLNEPKEPLSQKAGGLEYQRTIQS